MYPVIEITKRLDISDRCNLFISRSSSQMSRVLRNAGFALPNAKSCFVGSSTSFAGCYRYRAKIIDPRLDPGDALRISDPGKDPGNIRKREGSSEFPDGARASYSERPFRFVLA
uniref:Uncharacterized protein n=1 Tax=Candidatus Kentrum sp. LFY TaxID=2126342 RepID=A0A450WI07_9GAMM|nr:MAG: hypothetical protein BECKLFY1418C_GA0070996_102511 [Candidatus Kentron sp. LFY]